MKFREYLREAAGKNIKVGSKITWKNDDGDTLSGTIEKATKDMSGTKIFKIKAKLNNKGKEILTTWPVGEIMRKATVVKEYVESESECKCDELDEDELCEKCSESEDDDLDDDDEDDDEDEAIAEALLKYAAGNSISPDEITETVFKKFVKETMDKMQSEALLSRKGAKRFNRIRSFIRGKNGHGKKINRLTGKRV